MSLIAFLGVLELGLIYGLVAIGVFLTLRVLQFPDLTVDGSFPMGAAVAATLSLSAVNPYLATAVAMLSGAVLGLVTAYLAVKWKILHLLAGILTMIGAYSLVIRVMGKPNTHLLNVDTIVSPFTALGMAPMYARVVVTFFVVALLALVIIRVLESDFGLGLRASGGSERVASSLGVNTALSTYVVLALSNALVATAGAVFAATNGFADVAMGIGTIVFGLAAVILGETLMPTMRIWQMIVACILGSIVYRFAIALALKIDFIGLQASDLNLLTVILVTFALIAPQIKKRRQMKQWISRQSVNQQDQTP